MAMLRPRPKARYARHARRGRRAALRGFTLYESIFVMVMLGLVAAVVLAIQPQILKTQNTGRDALVGQEILRACAERMLTTRRLVGYASVTTSLCASTLGGEPMGGMGNFNNSPVVTMRDANNNPITACATPACLITITAVKPVGQAAELVPLTLRLRAY